MGLVLMRSIDRIVHRKIGISRRCCSHRHSFKWIENACARAVSWFSVRKNLAFFIDWRNGGRDDSFILLWRSIYSSFSLPYVLDSVFWRLIRIIFSISFEPSIWNRLAQCVYQTFIVLATSHRCRSIHLVHSVYVWWCWSTVRCIWWHFY